MKRAWLAPLLVLVLVTPARAAHGLLNSFSDIQWLAPPAVSPDAWYYRLVALKEDLSVRLAATPAERATLCLGALRARLGEALAMVKRSEVDAATLALRRYDQHLDCATDLLGEATLPDLPLRLTTALLEQRYMISVEYPDLPSGARGVLEHWMVESAARYATVRAALPRSTLESLFFKEEEVRWSWEMAQRAVPDTPPPEL